MATTPAPNPRASLLAGLRTGGVRSASSPISNVPHTAAPGGSFNVSRHMSVSHNAPYYPEDDEYDMAPQNMYAHHNANMLPQHQPPRTAAVDGPNHRFMQQQSGQMVNGGGPMTPFDFQGMQAQAQALQMQMMQMEIMRLQALQASQQYQAAEMLAQMQQQQQPQSRRQSAGFKPPSTAGAMNATFDLRNAALSAQMRHASQNQAQQLRSQLGVQGADDQVPMTAALGGKFGSRAPQVNGGRYGHNKSGSGSSASDEESGLMAPPTTAVTPATPSRTTVISGGTSLGNLASNNLNSESGSTPSKSDSASSWRRGGNNNSVLSGHNRPASNSSSPSVSVRISPPGSERTSPPPLSAGGHGPTKSRPQPLRFSNAVQQSLPEVTIESSEATDGDDGDISSPTSSGGRSAGSGRLSSTPNTPPYSSSSNGSHGQPPLSPREEASKKLYEGLGIGRPVPAPQTQQTQVQTQAVLSHRMVSQPVRQPRGPPSGADELGPKNFATRIRRKAIGGLGALMGARERREVVEAF